MVRLGYLDQAKGRNERHNKIVEQFKKDYKELEVRAEQAEAELKHCRESNWIGEKQRSKHIAERVKAEAERDELKEFLEHIHPPSVYPQGWRVKYEYWKDWKQTGGG